MKRVAVLPVLVLTFSLLATGCGGDDEPEEEPISTADFRTQADEICADGNAEIEAEAEALGDQPTQEQIEQFAVEVLVPNLQEQHDDIAALGAPEGDEDQVQGILDALQEGIDAVEADPSLVTSSDDPLEEASELADEYGLIDCSVV